MARVLRVLLAAILLAAGVALIFVLTDWLQALVDLLIERVGAVWGLAVVGVATLVLGFLWLRYGGARVLRRWGVVLKPRRSDPGAAASDAGRKKRLVGPKK